MGKNYDNICNMHLSRNFAWSLDLSDREFKVVMKKLRGEALSGEEESLVKKVTISIDQNASRLERISSGSAYRGPRSKDTPTQPDSGSLCEPGSPD
jgi:hypothetical protein